MRLTDPPDPPVVLLDACVLAPLTTREALLACAREGLFAPRWSARIEAEWRAAVLKQDTAPPEALLDGEIALARAAFPEACVTGWEAQEGALSLPDWNDRHVLAAAITAGASLLVTDNLRDFPRRALAGFGIAPESADAFLWRLAGAAPEAVAAALKRCAPVLGFGADPAAGPATDPWPGPWPDPRETARALKRARLPRFAKAVLALAET